MDIEFIVTGNRANTRIPSPSPTHKGMFDLWAAGNVDIEIPPYAAVVFYLGYKLIVPENLGLDVVSPLSFLNRGLVQEGLVYEGGAETQLIVRNFSITPQLVREGALLGHLYGFMRVTPTFVQAPKDLPPGFGVERTPLL